MSSEPTLGLLSPWALQPEMTLDDAHRGIARDTLRALLAVLDAPAAKARGMLDALINDMPPVTTRLLVPENTNTVLSVDAVADYDRYFAIDHVESDNPAMTMLHSLLGMLQRFFTLCEHLDNLETQAIATQKEGLRSYVHLLARTLRLELAPT